MTSKQILGTVKSTSIQEAIAFNENEDEYYDEDDLYNEMYSKRKNKKSALLKDRGGGGYS
jgi:hypothetical protein